MALATAAGGAAAVAISLAHDITDAYGAAAALDLRAIFWTNLLLLGFKPSDHRNHAVELHANVFAGARGGPSAAKAMEIIVHFLFVAIDAQAAQERFAKCWPIIDRMQSRDFRIAIVKWFDALKRDGNLAADVSVRKSYFDECRGERFERALLALSNCALKQAITRECVSAGGISVDENVSESCNAEILKAHIEGTRKQLFAESTQHSTLENQRCVQTDDLLSEHRQISLRMTQVQTDRRELDTVLKDLFGEPITPAAALARIEERIEQIAQEWQNLVRWVAANRENMHMIDDGEARTRRKQIDSLPPDVADVARLWDGLHLNVISTVGELVDTRGDTPNVDVGRETTAQLLKRKQADAPTTLVTSIQDLTRRLGSERAVLGARNAKLLATAAGRHRSVTTNKDARACRGLSPPAQTAVVPPSMQSRPRRVSPPSTPARLLAVEGYTATPDAARAVAAAVRSEVVSALGQADDRAAETEAAVVRERVDAAIAADESKAKPLRGGMGKTLTAVNAGASARAASAASSPMHMNLRERVSRLAAGTDSSTSRIGRSTSTRSQPANPQHIKDVAAAKPPRHEASGEKKSRKDHPAPAAYERLCERIVDFVNDMAESPPPLTPAPAHPAAVLVRGRRVGADESANAFGRGSHEMKKMASGDDLLNREAEGDVGAKAGGETLNGAEWSSVDAFTAALDRHAFRARAEIARTPERAKSQAVSASSSSSSNNNSNNSASRRLMRFPVTSPHVLRLPSPSYGAPCSPSPTKTSSLIGGAAAAHQPKTPSKLANVVLFDSSSDSLGSVGDAQSIRSNGGEGNAPATAQAMAEEFLEAESSYQLDPDELDELGGATPFFTLAEMEDGGGGSGEVPAPAAAAAVAAPAAETADAAARAAALAVWNRDRDDDNDAHDADDDTWRQFDEEDDLLPADGGTPRRTPRRRETCAGLDLLGEWGSPSGSFGNASPSFSQHGR
ncbi:hypothetical protein HDU86_007796 [Geranomyces michiganensis]|nr:hypothetical protein HDU86_007796 [Geranomyces michiganensis]